MSTKRPAIYFVVALLSACAYACTSAPAPVTDRTAEKIRIDQALDSFNRAAGASHFDEYFAFYTDDAVFTGTDATERWNKQQFMIWAKPHFDAKKAWNFSSLERHIYFDSLATLAWFDELLKTQMKICRGSGVLVKTDAGWKLKQYILSTTIPNQQLDSIAIAKAPYEDSIITRLQQIAR